ncbi:unnamed protein product [Heligmosomoides polygyrus]|uniref:START domain-containing protein n=1 Tax=Heligmosomoides polygyrus TaxID=6339 RepID=A0A3P7YBW4_HELPZ|nr:unnamed protein product [Heligmosomoides polygyrus]
MEIVKSLRRVLESIPGVSSIFLTDRDGVIVLSVGEELRSRVSLISSLQATQDQTGKLIMGPHLSSVFFYESSQLVILNVAPLTAFIVASPTASTYSILKLREQLEPLLQDIENIVPDIPGGHEGESNGWEKLVEEKDLKVFRRLVHGPYEMYEYKCIGTYYDISPAMFLDVQNDLEFRSNWDTNVLSLDMLKEEDEHELIRWVQRFPYPLYPREYIYTRRTWISVDTNTVIVDSEVIPTHVHDVARQTERSGRKLQWLAGRMDKILRRLKREKPVTVKEEPVMVNAEKKEEVEEEDLKDAIPASSDVEETGSCTDVKEASSTKEAKETNSIVETKGSSSTSATKIPSSSSDTKESSPPSVADPPSEVAATSAKD